LRPGLPVAGDDDQVQVGIGRKRSTSQPLDGANRQEVEWAVINPEAGWADVESAIGSTNLPETRGGSRVVELSGRLAGFLADFLTDVTAAAAAPAVNRPPEFDYTPALAPMHFS
jgi:hypothetical protein